MTFAPLPATVQGMAGPITVSRPQKIEGGAWGMWVASQRTILVFRGLSRRVAWQVLYHEMIHAALWDSGINLDSETEERVCDVTSGAMMAGLGAPQLSATTRPPSPTATRPRGRARRR